MTTNSIDNIFSAFDKNVDASILDASPLSLVDEWIDTGSYALNAILSGSVYRGIPKGRIGGFSGPSGCGKTLMIMKAMGTFLNEDSSHYGVVFDSETAVDKATAISLGCDPKRIKHVPVHTVTDVRNQCLAFLNAVIESNQQGKFFISVDSLGNLAADKEIADALADKSASDMGLRAKQLKSLLRVLTYRAAKAKTTIVFSNHTYSDPAAMYPSAVKNQSGGEGPIYMASWITQLGFKRQKNEKDFENEEILSQAKQVGGILMHALTIKNRFIPPMLETDLYLNFKTGLDRYSGLFEIAKNLGVIEGSKTYNIGETKLGYRKQFEKDPEVWENIILPELEPVINREFQFSQNQMKEAYEQSISES